MNDTTRWWENASGVDECPCHAPLLPASLATCECATAQIKPTWDGHERLVCEDCHGRIAPRQAGSGSAS